METSQQFLRLVLPSPGHGLYCACELNNKKHVFADDPAKLLEQIDKWVAAGRDVYFALATFEEKNRRAENARAIKSLFIDMDGYDSPKDAAQALFAFLAKTELDTLGSPTLVISGGGIHAYWPFTETVDLTTWQPIAENFKRLCVQEGLTIDRTVTADAARVLRVPGTFNFKKKYGEPRAVRIKHLGGEFSLQALSDAILAKLEDPEEPSNVLPFPLQGPGPAGPGVVTMFENDARKTFFAKLRESRECGQLQHYLEHPQEDGMEPLWRGFLSWAKACDDGVEEGRALSALHPYDPERHQRKWIEIKGPYKCSDMETQGQHPEICKQCRHRGKITNPLRFGWKVPEAEEAPVMDVPEEEPVSEVQQPPERAYRLPDPKELPPGYFYPEEGDGIYRSKSVMIGKKKETLEVPVSSYYLYPEDLLETDEENYVPFVYIDDNGIRKFTLPASAVAAKDKTLSLLGKHGILAQHDPEDLYQYVAKYVGMKVTRKRKRVPTYYGWQKDGTSFAYAQHVFRPGKPPLPVVPINMENLLPGTTPKGTLAGWQTVCALFVRRHKWRHLAAFLAGACAPLMRFTGFNGLTVHLCTAESGTGKSNTLDLISSVWGSPQAYKMGKGSSPLALQHRLGSLHNLPLVVDEITENNRKDPEWFANHLLAMTEGKGKDRMMASENRERLNVTSWSTMSVLSSNTHGLDILQFNRTHSADGEFMRLLEFKMHGMVGWTQAEERVIAAMEEHHGIVGWHLAQYLVDHLAELEGMVRAKTDYVRTLIGGAGPERFWRGGIAAALVLRDILEKMGIARIPEKVIEQVFVDIVEEMRELVGAGKQTPERLISEYLQEFAAGDMVKVFHGDGVVRGINDRPQLPRGAVMGRVDVDKLPGWTQYQLPVRAFRRFCADRNYDYVKFTKEAKGKLLDGLVYGGEHEVDLFSGTQAKGAPRLRCLMISLHNEKRPDIDDAPLSVDAA